MCFPLDTPFLTLQVLVRACHTPSLQSAVLTSGMQKEMWKCQAQRQGCQRWVSSPNATVPNLLQELCTVGFPLSRTQFLLPGGIELEIEFKYIYLHIYII